MIKLLQKQNGAVFYASQCRLFPKHRLDLMDSRPRPKSEIEQGSRVMYCRTAIEKLHLKSNLLQLYGYILIVNCYVFVTCDISIKQHA